MIVKVLGVIDITAAIALFVARNNYNLNIGFMIIVAILLVGKFFLSITNIFGWIDLFIALILIIEIFFNIPNEILFIMGIIVAGKGLTSIFS